MILKKILRIALVTFLSLLFVRSPFNFATNPNPIIGLKVSNSPATTKALKRIKAKIVANKPIVFIALDGGGVRGVIPATILADLEEKARMKVSDIADFIIGTSTGAILSALLTYKVKMQQGNPRYITAYEIADVYRTLSRNIFQKKMLGLLAVKYDNEKAFAAFEDIFDSKVNGELKPPTRYSDASIPIATISYSFNKHKTIIFSSVNQFHKYALNPYLVTSGLAPTYFKSRAFKVGNITHDLTDGGLGANINALYAMIFAKKLISIARKSLSGSEKNKKAKLVILSLGTGNTVDLKEANRTDRGLLQGSLIGDLQVTVKGFQESQKHLSSAALEQYCNSNQTRLMACSYYRLQVPLGKTEDAMDLVSNEHFNNLIKAASNYIVASKSYKDFLRTIGVNPGAKAKDYDHTVYISNKTAKEIFLKVSSSRTPEKEYFRGKVGAKKTLAVKVPNNFLPSNRLIKVRGCLNSETSACVTEGKLTAKRQNYCSDIKIAQEWGAKSVRLSFTEQKHLLSVFVKCQLDP